MDQFQQYFSYIVAASFIDEGNWSTQRKPQVSHKSLSNFITIAEILLKVALNTISLTLYKLNLSSDDLLDNNHFQSK
jgi:hypothetical protein